MCFLCTMINGGRMHYMRLFGFKASSVQRYSFLNNLISCCRYSESQTDFGGSTWKRISRKYRQISSQLPSWVRQQEWFTDQEAIWWCSNWNMQLEDCRRSHRDRNQPKSAILPDQCLFCKKSKYKPNTKTREKLHSVQEVCADDLNVPYPANYMIRYRGKSVLNIPQPINFLLYALNFLPKYPLSQSPQ